MHTNVLKKIYLTYEFSVFNVSLLSTFSVVSFVLITSVEELLAGGAIFSLKISLVSCLAGLLELEGLDGVGFILLSGTAYRKDAAVLFSEMIFFFFAFLSIRNTIVLVLVKI